MSDEKTADLKIRDNNFNFCPLCGGKNIKNMKMRNWLCSDCGFDLYNNVASAVGLIIKNKNNEILLEKRAKNPRQGFLALPGGFVDPNESAEEASFRECKEEIGIVPEKLRYIGSFPNTYQYRNIVYKTCDLFFEARFSDEEPLNFQKDEVLAVEWRKVETESDIEKIPLAFESAEKILKIWLRSSR